MDVSKIFPKRIILASASPRRKQILETLVGFELVIHPSTFDENLDKSKYTNEEYVLETSKRKALDVLNKRGIAKDELLVSCDTIVVR
jgi:septum formation protein